MVSQGTVGHVTCPQLRLDWLPRAPQPPNMPFRTGRSACDQHRGSWPAELIMEKVLATVRDEYYVDNKQPYLTVSVRIGAKRFLRDA